MICQTTYYRYNLVYICVIFFLLLNTFCCKTPKLYVVLRIQKRAMATVQNPTNKFHVLNYWVFISAMILNGTHILIISILVRVGVKKRSIIKVYATMGRPNF